MFSAVDLANFETDSTYPSFLGTFKSCIPSSTATLPEQDLPNKGLGQHVPTMFSEQELEIIDMEGLSDFSQLLEYQPTEENLSAIDRSLYAMGPIDSWCSNFDPTMATHPNIAAKLYFPIELNEPLSLSFQSSKGPESANDIYNLFPAPASCSAASESWRASATPSCHKPDNKLRTRGKRRERVRYLSKPGPLRASKTIAHIDGSTGKEILSFRYSRKKDVSEITISCPNIDIQDAYIQDHGDEFTEQFKRENCIYPRAMVPLEKYQGKRAKYERECNYIGWHLAYANPSIRNQRGLIQRAVDCWRNTRQDLALRSRRARKHFKDAP